MSVSRVLKHLSTGRASVRRFFPPATLEAIEQAIRAAEARHSGQIRFAVEASLELSPLLAGQTAQQRALDVFSRLRVWDTERNNGVLIYLLLADRDVEIIADRGVHARLGSAAWEAICREMEAAFRERRFAEGVLAGIGRISALLAEHYPRTGAPGANELPDRPVVL